MTNRPDWSPFSSLDQHDLSSPDSVCSRPCEPRLYYQYRDPVCCWDCLACRNNEILNEGKNGCVVCSALTWPDEETATTCIPIPPE